ncbi:hypothetical protein PG994_014882 [Apiospora phragmitis]|uniref:Uncharacterized protein n=1 Tax=Apiospora phragmitis TaxID=2905665 RepID=A0ABR1SUW2_9PEZI
MVGTAYMTRGLKLVSGSSKRAITERAEEMERETDEIPMTTPTSAGGRTPDTESEPHHSPRPSQVHLADAAVPEESADTTGTSTPTIPPDLPPQAPLTPPRTKQWAVMIAANLDVATYFLLFVLVGIPVFYGTGYAMPIQLTFSILSYFGALALPPTWRQFLHPVLVSALFTVLGIWVIGLTIGRDLDSTLREYKVGANYARVWNGSHQLPGAGDMFSTVLDASIIALALPMYQYRRELKQHFLDDYVTRGVTLGANSSAMATALLLRTDPRAAALSSLAMSLFGAITVLFSSIPPPIANAVRSLAGL